MVLPFKLSVVEDSNKAERALAKAVVDQVLKKKESLIGLAWRRASINNNAKYSSTLWFKSNGA